MDLDTQIAQAEALLANAARLKELTEKRKVLTDDLAAVSEELSAILGTPTSTNGTGSGRKCALCGETGHIIGRKKAADGGDTCKTYPTGKPNS